MDILIFIIIFMNIMTLFNIIGYVVASERLKKIDDVQTKESIDEFRNLLVSITTVELSVSTILSVVYAIAYAISTF